MCVQPCGWFVQENEHWTCSKGGCDMSSFDFCVFNQWIIIVKTSDLCVCEMLSDAILSALSVSVSCVYLSWK